MGYTNIVTPSQAPRTIRSNRSSRTSYVAYSELGLYTVTVRDG